jgi:UDP-glucose 4-epimerase
MSVLQIMAAMAEVSGVDFTPDVVDRRPGDPARIVASGELAARDLGWTPRRSLTDCVASAWQAWHAAASA